MASPFAPFSFGHSALAFYGLSGSGKTTTIDALGVTYTQKFPDARLDLMKLFGREYVDIQKAYKFGVTWKSDKLARQLSFMPTINQEHGITQNSYTALLYPSHPYYHKGVPKGYESTGIMMNRFTVGDAELGIVEFGSLLLMPPERVTSTFAGDQEYQDKKRAWDDLTRSWLKKAHGSETEEGCMRKTLRMMPENTKHVWLVDFNEIADTPITERNLYVKQVDEQLDFYKKIYGDVTPYVLVLKTDNASINGKEQVLHPETPWDTATGIDLLQNCGFEPQEAARIQTDLLKEHPPEGSLEPIFGAVQGYFDKYAQNKVTVIGGGSIFRPYDYDVLVSSILKAGKRSRSPDGSMRSATWAASNSSS